MAPFSLPWACFWEDGGRPGRVVLSLPALLLSWKIPLKLQFPLFYTHLIGLDHFHVLLSQATAVQFVPDSSTFFFGIYWFCPACLGHYFFVSALVNPTTLCPWLSLCVYSDLCLHVAVRGFLPSMILFSTSYQKSFLLNCPELRGSYHTLVKIVSSKLEQNKVVVWTTLKHWQKSLRDSKAGWPQLQMDLYTAVCQDFTGSVVGQINYASVAGAKSLQTVTQETMLPGFGSSPVL